MKKQVSKITLKTDTILSLSKAQALNVVGGRPKRETESACTSKICEP
ncbi:class I lanthipeptide [Larkinella bovis]|uniref:Class I lanthipeptide n=1 Tax=Larkinella bovis TaxID=683041 RepID=A0ABW0I9T9_9BACT